ncbi:uncharacterized protein LOC126324751 isoform X2 [Schistocerca gregaria]|nr:uncharacterized protein LOC126324751 isoform X2 [Schistocerca gregaria]
MSTTRKFQPSKKLAEIFQEVKVKDVSPPVKELWKAGIDDTLKKVQDLMVQHHIRSLPIFNAITGQFEHFIDFVDILHFIVEDVGVSRKESLENWYRSSKLVETTCCQLISHLSHNSDRSQMVFINQNDCIQTAINMLSMRRKCDRKSRAPLRLAVLDEGGQLVSVLTKRMLVKFICRLSEGYLHPLYEHSIDSLCLVSKDPKRSIVVFNLDNTVCEAFLTCYEKNIHSVGIVDENGEYIACAEAEKMAFPSHTSRQNPSYYFNMPLKRYITLSDLDSNSRAEPGFVTKHCTAHDLLMCFKDNTFNQVYVVESLEKKVCIGVISLGDIINLFRSDSGPDGHSRIQNEE